ncbi:flavodoxin family protein [Epibacterium ulvae]|uniref:flavodoxin family protein n=1 Tax=Epibacterium ulvae TaxID=1156985 RepID=UPI001BFCC368|nr:flavodoxin family protein [Epibacterium ulvae]MBT8153693.1 flavodoxin family protein [Epibacterium ulvae]
MARIEIIYFSGYGHTARQAQAVLEGAQTKGEARLWAIPEDGVVSDELWAAADAADALIFGAPTYMGNAPWQFKRFADDSSKRWFERAWADKFAGGFTNSGSNLGDKGETLNYFRVLAGQHGMLWVPLNQMPSNLLASTADDRNWGGGTAGAVATSPADSSPEQGPRPGDLISAHDYGVRIAEIAAVRG